jgi:hypothetical protein
MENIKLFEAKKYPPGITNKRNGFSIVDIAALTDSNNPQVYWRVLKKTTFG